MLELSWTVNLEDLVALLLLNMMMLKVLQKQEQSRMERILMDDQ